MPLCPQTRRLLLAMLAIAGLAGCHAVDFYESALQQAVPPEMEPPRELSKVSLPAYRVEPPDMLMIEMLKMVPRPPYRIEIYDVLQIRVHRHALSISPSTASSWSRAKAIVTLRAGLRPGARGGHDRRGGRRTRSPPS